MYNRWKSWFGFKILFCTCIFKAVGFIFFFKSRHLGLQKHGLKIQEDGSLRSKTRDPSFSWSSVLTYYICSRLIGKPKDRGTGIITSFSGTVYHSQYFLNSVIHVLIPIGIIYLYNRTGPWVNNSQAFILTWCHKHLAIISPANTLDLIFVIVYCCKGGKN